MMCLLSSSPSSRTGFFGRMSSKGQAVGIETGFERPPSSLHTARSETEMSVSLDNTNDMIRQADQIVGDDPSLTENINR